MKINPRLQTFLRVTISVVLIAYIIKSQDIKQIGAVVKQFHPIYLFLSIFLLLIGTYISSIRWRTILETSGKQVSEKHLFGLYLQGYFYNNFLPTQMGGDIYKSVALGKHINDQSTALFSVFMDRFSGLIILMIMGLFGISSLYGAKVVFLVVILFTVGLLLYFPILRFMAKKVGFIVKFEKASTLLVYNKKKGILILFYSFLIQLLSFLLIYLLFVGNGVHLPVWSVFAYMPIASLSSLIPSFNGYGTQELVYAFLFAGAGITSAVSIATSVMVHLVRLVMSLLGGLRSGVQML